MKAVAIDDIPEMTELLADVLELINADIKIVATATNVEDGVATIKQVKPDILFLDIELGGGATSFDILEQLDAEQYAIIFISAHAEYGISVLEFEGLAYLEKPIDPDKLEKSITRAKKRHAERESIDKVESLNKALQDYKAGRKLTRLVMSNAQGHHRVYLKDILYLTGGKGLTQIIVSDGRKISNSEDLSDFRKKFKDFPNFYKGGSHYLINIDHVIAIKTNAVVLMDNNDEFSIPARDAKIIRDNLGDL